MPKKVKTLCWCKVGGMCKTHLNAPYRLRIYRPRFVRFMFEVDGTTWRKGDLRRVK